MQKIDIRKTSALKTRMQMQMRMSKKTQNIRGCGYPTHPYLKAFLFHVLLKNVYQGVHTKGHKCHT